MQILENFSLKSYNTFGLNAVARYFAPFNSKESLVEILSTDIFARSQRLILGGGSNILFLKDFNGIVVHPENKGIEIIKENASTSLVRVAAGEEWDDFVLWAVNNNLAGVENLSHIPGCVGAAPVQNIGAYGVEAKDVIHEVTIFDFKKNRFDILNKDQLHFSYRDSVFKHEFKDACIVVDVVFELSKKHVYNVSYKGLDSKLKECAIVNLQTIRNSIIEIRNEKLPDPKIQGNAGSFFKNPVVEEEDYLRLSEIFDDIVAYKLDNRTYKIAAGWLIDTLGWKGKYHRDAAVHDKQALVLVNKGNATGVDILQLSKNIQDDVFSKFSIILEPEVLFV
ncbi:MAG: UDP-N-acetylmuramate dehydrogenase [Bacteroidales bacterium]|nr:UDP-N-acetylmuramate dehydrogenase [Bacteroidales bacterium]